MCESIVKLPGRKITKLSMLDLMMDTIVRSLHALLKSTEDNLCIKHIDEVLTWRNPDISDLDFPHIFDLLLNNKIMAARKRWSSKNTILDIIVGNIITSSISKNERNKSIMDPVVGLRWFWIDYFPSILKIFNNESHLEFDCKKFGFSTIEKQKFKNAEGFFEILTFTTECMWSENSVISPIAQELQSALLGIENAGVTGLLAASLASLSAKLILNDELKGTQILHRIASFIEYNPKMSETLISFLHTEDDANHLSSTIQILSKFIEIDGTVCNSVLHFLGELCYFHDSLITVLKEYKSWMPGILSIFKMSPKSLLNSSLLLQIIFEKALEFHEMHELLYKLIVEFDLAILLIENGLSRKLAHEFQEDDASFMENCLEVLTRSVNLSNVVDLPEVFEAIIKMEIVFQSKNFKMALNLLPEGRLIHDSFGILIASLKGSNYWKISHIIEIFFEILHTIPLGPANEFLLLEVTNMVLCLKEKSILKNHSKDIRI
ncbi:hypothetical protein HK096_000641, partial [Nowakowskiella sp. JEL0078]